ncbi:hypothetical protein V6Z12_D06G031400 [Gossypium hirsutum]
MVKFQPLSITNPISRGGRKHATDNKSRVTRKTKLYENLKTLASGGRQRLARVADFLKKRKMNINMCF